MQRGLKAKPQPWWELRQQSSKTSLGRGVAGSEREVGGDEHFRRPSRSKKKKKKTRRMGYSLEASTPSHREDATAAASEQGQHHLDSRYIQ